MDRPTSKALQGNGGVLSRRNFLMGSMLAAGSGMLGGFGPSWASRWARAAAADTASERYFVFCYFSGGWDVLLSLDPRDPVIFHPGNIKNTLIYPGYELLDVTDGQLVQTDAGITFGPAIGDMAAHANKLCVIRGMSMDTLTHEVGRRRFITGKPPSGLQARGSSASTHLAARLGSEQPIANLSMRVESYNDDQPNFSSALKVSNVSDLMRALEASEPSLSWMETQQIDELLGLTAQCPGALTSGFWQESEEARVRSQALVAAELQSNFDFMANNTTMEALRDHYGITSSNQAQSSPAAQAAFAAQALKTGVSRVVSIQVATGLDTHYSEWDRVQPTEQMEGFSAVSRLIEDLENSEYGQTGTSWLDHTTLIGFSEFQRGALVNDRGGRDHSLTNACFLAGAGIQPATVIGRASDVAMAPTKTNLLTGLPDSEGEVIRPEHIIQALLHDIGVTEDEADLRVDPLLALLKNP